MFKILGAFSILGFWLACIAGYLGNIVQVVQMAIANDPVNTLFIMKAISILVAPVGVIFGWFGFFA